MSVTQPGVHDTGPRRRGREVFATIAAAVAALFSGLFLWVLADFVLNDYVEGEVLVGQIMLALIGTLTVYAWSGAVSLYKSARRAIDPVARRVTIGGLVAMPVLLIVSMFAPAGPVQVGAAVAASLAAVVALVGAIRE